MFNIKLTLYAVFKGDVLVAQAGVFFTAGYETSSTAMSFGLYELSFQPELQKKLRQEIKETLQTSNGEITYDNVLGMVYLNMVVQGTMKWIAKSSLITLQFFFFRNFTTVSTVTFSG